MSWRQNYFEFNFCHNRAQRSYTYMFIKTFIIIIYFYYLWKYHGTIFSSILYLHLFVKLVLFHSFLLYFVLWHVVHTFPVNRCLKCSHFFFPFLFYFSVIYSVWAICCFSSGTCNATDPTLLTCSIIFSKFKLFLKCVLQTALLLGIL